MYLQSTFYKPQYKCKHFQFTNAVATQFPQRITLFAGVTSLTQHRLELSVTVYHQIFNLS